MKKFQYITTGLALCGLLAGLTGCGLANTSEVRVIGGAASGNAVELPDSDKDVEMVSAGQTVEKSRYANSDNMYKVNSVWSDADKENIPVLIQMKADGNAVDEIEIKDLSDVVWVGDEWIYYTTDDISGLWRIPIEKTGSGDKLKVEEKEKLFEIDDGLIDDELVVTENSIFYNWTDDDINDHLCRYDFDSGESVVLMLDEDMTSRICFHGKDEYYRELWPVMVGDNLIIQTMKEDVENIGELIGGLYTLNLKSSELKNFYSDLSVGNWSTIITQSGDSIFFVPDKKRQQIYRFDGQTTECLLKKGELMEKMPELNLPMEGEISFRKIFSCKERLYFLVALESEQDYPYISDKVSFLLSAPVDEPSQIRHEEKVTDYLKNETNNIFLYEDSQGEIKKGKNTMRMEDMESFYSFTGPMDFRVLFNRKLILQGRNYTSKLSGVSYTSFDYAVYDLETGEIEETEAGKAMQQGDEQKLIEIYELPWEDPWKEID